ncbi:MAG: metallophosphoesterase, partial [Candidatus Cloacimonetes bacterium]|nr:metallophosphoesterase [Candidatus Cloacimonadota bacterium]
QFSIFNFQLKRKEKEQKVSFRFAIVADSHEDEVYFPQILQRIKKENVDFLIHLGDLVNSGDLEKIRQGKDFLDNSGVPYYIIPGDHDYNWQPEHSLANFKEVFGNEQIYPPNRRVYSSFGHKGFFFILFDNSDNTNEVDVTQLKWLKDELEEHATNYQPSTTNKFVFCHKPLLNPYFPDKVDPNGTAVLELLTDYKVTQVFSGNVHTFARYPDSQTGIGITTIGAAGTYKNPLPQYALVTVFEDGSFNVEAKPYKEIRLGE